MNPFKIKNTEARHLAEAALRFADTHNKEDWESLQVAAVDFAGVIVLEHKPKKKAKK